MNGKMASFRPNDPSHPVLLTQAQNMLTLTAPPFRPITCRIDIAAFGKTNLGRDTCQSEEMGVDGNQVPVLFMNYSLADLPVDQQLQIQTALHARLDQVSGGIQAIVPAGDQYASGIDPQGVPMVVTAQTSLYAQAVVTLPAMNYEIGCINGICPKYVDSGSYPNTALPTFFTLEFQAHIGWRFFNVAGSLIAVYLPTAFGDNHGRMIDYSQGFDLGFHYDGATGWQAIDTDPELPNVITTNQFANDVCQIGETMTTNVFLTNGGVSLPGPPSLEGCLFVLNGGGTDLRGVDLHPLEDIQHAWYLVHFGAVLAVNDMAHRLLPQLPRATSDEVNTICQLQKLACTSS